MDIIQLLVLRLIKDLEYLNIQLKEMCDVLTESKREANPCPIQESEGTEQADDRTGQ